MPVNRIDPLPDGADFRLGSIGIWSDSTTRKSVDIAAARLTLSGGARNRPADIAARTTALLQAQFDVRIPLADLPLDDPDRTTDPARPDLFWDGTDLVGRGVRLTVSWDAAISRYNLMCENVAVR